MTARLRIRKHDDDHIALNALSGVTHYGFGTFLENITPEQIDADEFSRSALLASSEKHALNGLEIWADNRVAWGDPAHEIIMPTSEISVHQGARSWLKQVTANQE